MLKKNTQKNSRLDGILPKSPGLLYKTISIKTSCATPMAHAKSLYIFQKVAFCGAVASVRNDFST